MEDIRLLRAEEAIENLQILGKNETVFFGQSKTEIDWQLKTYGVPPLFMMAGSGHQWKRIQTKDVF